MKSREKVYRIIIFFLLVVLLMSQYSYDISAAVKCKSVALNVTKATIGGGDILPLTAITKPLNATGTQKWTSSDKKVATVNKYGAVTGVGEGTAKITVKIGKKRATCSVTVSLRPSIKDTIDIKDSLNNYVKKEDISVYALKKDVYTKGEVDELIKNSTSSKDNDGNNTAASDENVDKTLIHKDEDVEIYYTYVSGVLRLYAKNLRSDVIGFDFEYICLDGKELLDSNSGNTLSFYNTNLGSGHIREVTPYIDTIKVSPFKEISGVYNIWEGTTGYLIKRVQF